MLEWRSPLALIFSAASSIWISGTKLSLVLVTLSLTTPPTNSCFFSFYGAKHVHEHSGIHGYALVHNNNHPLLPPAPPPPDPHSRLRRLDRLSALAAPQKAEIENVVIMLFMKLASRGRNTIEKPSIPPIRINTNQAAVLRLHGTQGTWRSGGTVQRGRGDLRIIIIILIKDVVGGGGWCVLECRG